MQLGKGAEIVSRLLVVHRRCTSESLTRIFNKESVDTGRERNKLHTSGPRIWVCSSSDLTDAAGNLEHTHHCRFGDQPYLFVLFPLTFAVS